MFWILLRRLWPAWSNVLIIVKPETVVAWHRAGFRLFWRLRSRRKKVGRPTVDGEVRALIRRRVEENPTWGAPRIHGELLKRICLVESIRASRLRATLTRIRIPAARGHQRLWRFSTIIINIVCFTPPGSCPRGARN
jgi:hypothetical protein